MTIIREAIPEDVKARLHDAMEEIQAMDPEANSMDGPLVEEEFEGVEIRMFPTGPDGAEMGVTELYFEVTVSEDNPFYEELGVYSADNIRNGGPFYEALEQELVACIDEVFGHGTAQGLDLIMQKGSSGFTGSVAFR